MRALTRLLSPPETDSYLSPDERSALTRLLSPPDTDLTYNWTPTVKSQFNIMHMVLIMGLNHFTKGNFLKEIEERLPLIIL